MKEIGKAVMNISGLTLIGSSLGEAGKPITNFTQGVSSTMKMTGTMVGSMLMLQSFKRMKGEKK